MSNPYPAKEFLAIVALLFSAETGSYAQPTIPAVVNKTGNHYCRPG